MFYDWKWYYSALGIILWIVTLLALIGLKSNHDSRAWLIFMPVLLLYLLWTIFKKIISGNSTQVQFFEVIIDSIVFGQAIMWLLAGKTSKASRFSNFLISLIVMTTIGILAIISSLGFGFSVQRIGTAIVVAVVSLAIVGGESIAGFMCRRKYVMAIYLLWVALWEIVLIVIPVAIYGVIMVIVMMSQNAFAGIFILFGLAVSGGILGVMVYVMSLPFLILVQKNRFWRQRFERWTQTLRPKPLIPTEPSANSPLI